MEQLSAVGLCGCGNMGAAIARRLGRRTKLSIYDVDERRAIEVAEQTGAGVAGDPGAVADAASVVVLSLPNPEASRIVVEQLLPNLGRGSVVVETSTVAPKDMHTLLPACRNAGVHLVDAAILAGVAQMDNGDALLLVGGDEAARAAAAPVLDLLSHRRRELGPLGSGMVAKIANNAVSHAVMVVLLEAAAIVESNGLSTRVFAELLTLPDAGLMRPLTHRLQQRVMSGDYDGGMPVALAAKDSVLATQVAQEARVPLFTIQAAHTPYELALAAGLGRHDYAALAQLWEKWADVSFGAVEPGRQ